ncbi:phosphomannomutase [Paragemmobacter straminiformis]|uniref:Phosphomannomutase n=1 Tax=Paragemmobacter straminiformis TaxID=2045119 RepID=A0A842IAD7_9RHOB|nr:phosphomannomutase [Gemmobacter straminiformis]MBC2836561.1 phosphomannomutase [Gemmobacter straminiformis]
MLTCFKAYDVRGRIGVDFDAGIACRIARAFVAETAEAGAAVAGAAVAGMGARRVVLARDSRASSAGIAMAVAEALAAVGVEVLDLGLAGTEEMYFATAETGAVGGICVTASHNPKDYNGMKLAGTGAAPLPKDVFAAIRARAEAAGDAPDGMAARASGGRVTDAAHLRRDYAARIAGMVDRASLRPLRVLFNCGNGAAGPTLDAVLDALGDVPLAALRMHHEPDGAFPNGVPNPLLPANRPVTARAVLAQGADLAVAFDGDFDRCFLFDETGAFVPGEYVVALLARVFLAREAGARIVHDPRVVLATRDTVRALGGEAVMARTGHGYMKQALRETGAVYGGEMSAHHYFRDFHACDSGMIPWLLVLEEIGRSGKSLSELVASYRAGFPSSGEINYSVSDPAAAIESVARHYAPLGGQEDHTDGLSLDFGDWRLNLRASNTESYLRLNVESRGRPDLVERAVAEIGALLAGVP